MLPTPIAREEEEVAGDDDSSPPRLGGRGGDELVACKKLMPEFSCPKKRPGIYAPADILSPGDSCGLGQL